MARWLTPRLRYTLSLVVLIRLLLPTSPSSVLSYENFVPPVAHPHEHRRHRCRFQIPTTAVATTIQRPGVSSPPTPTGASDQRSVSEVYLIVWTAGCLGLLFLAGWRLGKWNRLVRAGRRISDARLLELLNAAREVMRVRRPVELVAIDRLKRTASSGCSGWCLPETGLQELNEILTVFLHELAHVRRRDIPYRWPV